MKRRFASIAASALALLFAAHADAAQIFVNGIDFNHTIRIAPISGTDTNAFEIYSAFGGPGNYTPVFLVDDAGNLTVNSCTGCVGATGGFPITLGSTSIASSSTTTTIASLTLFNPTLSGTIAGTPTYSGVPIFSGLSLGTQLECLGLDSGNHLVELSGPCGTGSGAGTVTSVALTVPSWLTVGGSPITTSGTLAVTGTSESANLFLASPNGSSGALSPRAIVAADLPAIPTTDLTGTLQAAQFPALTGDVTTTAGALGTTIAANAVTNAKTAQMTANTVKGNFTASSANAADNAVPSCTDSAGNHLNYTPGTGLTCGTTSSGGSTTITLSPGLAATPGTYNAGAQTITNGSTVSPQTFYEGHATSYSVATTDGAKLLTATAASVLFTAPNPGTVGSTTYQFGYDNSHSYSLTTAGGTASIYGCGSTGTTLTGLAYPVGIITDGTNYLCIPNGAGGGSGITTLTGDVTAGPGSGSQAATLAASGVSAGTYTNPTVTFDAKGRATSAASGAGGGSALQNPVQPTFWPITFAPGNLAALPGTTVASGFVKIPISASVLNITLSTEAYTCSGAPTISLRRCGTSATCAASSDRGSGSPSATAGTSVDVPPTDAAVPAGDYLAWEFTAGTCSALDVQAIAMLQSNPGYCSTDSQMAFATSCNSAMQSHT